MMSLFVYVLYKIFCFFCSFDIVFKPLLFSVSEERFWELAKLLDDKIAIVTGASRGIGREISLWFAREGATVVLAARAMELLEKVAREVNDCGQKAHVVSLEVQDEESIKNLVKTVADKFGKLDILVNNAGITHSGKLEDTTTEDWDRVMRINARGQIGRASCRKECRSRWSPYH